MPRSLHHATADSYLGPYQTGNRNAEPIAPRSDLGEKGSLVSRVAIAAVAPAASAVRRMAPTFTGLLIRCMTTIRVLCLMAEKCSALDSGLDASTTIPCGVLV